MLLLLLLLHLLVLFVHHPLVTARVIGITSDMESKFTPSFLAVLQEQRALIAQYNSDHPPAASQELPHLRVSISANTDWAWREAIEAPGNGGRSRMERAMEIVDELIVMDYTATCHRPGTGSGADSPCDTHEFMQQAYPFFAHSRLLKSRSGNRSHEVLISLALEVFGDPQPDPARTRGGWNDHRVRTTFELESFLNKSASRLGPPNPRGTIPYYGCYNLFDEWCPFHTFAIFEHTNYFNVTSLWPCPPDETVCDLDARPPRSIWLYDVWRPMSPFDTVESGLLFDAQHRHAFIAWCHEQRVNELYLEMDGLPGCDVHANATTAAALRNLFEELDAASVDIQMFVGDVLGSGCPNHSGCGILDCTRASLDFARQLRNHSGTAHIGPSRSKTDDDGFRKPVDGWARGRW